MPKELYRIALVMYDDNKPVGKSKIRTKSLISTNDLLFANEVFDMFMEDLNKYPHKEDDVQKD